MKVHQVNWYRSDSILKFHHISCVDCRGTIAKCCKHFEIGKMKVNNKCVSIEEDPLKCTDKKVCLT
jgi:hypothetical protein